MNFKKFGMDFILGEGDPASVLSRLDVTRCQVIATTPVRVIYVVSSDVRIELQQVIGTGSYGNVYSATFGGKPAVVKEVQIPKRHIQAGRAVEYINGLAREALINIIIYETCKEKGIIPFVPEIYQICTDGETIYIAQEKLDGTIHDFIQDQASKGPGGKMPERETIGMIAELADKIYFLQTNLHFNHRDMKTDNIMYRLTPTTASYTISIPTEHITYNVPNSGISLFLIDFGFCCITYKGTQITSRSVFADGRPCERIGRDTAQLLFSLFLMGSLLEDSVLDFLRYCLMIRVGNVTCSLPATCVVFGMREWEDVYAFLDREDVVYSRADPLHLLRMIENAVVHGKPLPVAANDTFSLAIAVSGRTEYKPSPDNKAVGSTKTQKKSRHRNRITRK